MSSSAAPTNFKVGLTPQEKSLYTYLFKTLDPENTRVITGDKARGTFEKSGLPPAVLGEIWQIADQNNLGYLNQFCFCYAMRLIGYAQAGKQPKAGLADVPGPLPMFADISIPPPAQVQPQSTSNSFLSNQPGSSTPQPQSQSQSQPLPPPTSSSARDPFSSISQADYQRFSQLYARTVGSTQGELSGAQAKDIFVKARLPTAILGQIWNLVDRKNKGSLDVGSFVIAMHLIQGLLSGHVKQLPPYLPASIWQSVESYQQAPPPQQQPQQHPTRQVSNASVGSKQTTAVHRSARTPQSAPPQIDEWVATPAMKAQYDSIFSSLDKENKGQLNPDQVASFLMTSKLEQDDLASIWDLADIQNTGNFTKLEFGIALFLVNRKVAGKSLPNIVPESLLASLRSSAKPPPFTQENNKNNNNDNNDNNALGSAPQPPRSSETSTRGKSSIDDLVDIFGSASPQPGAAAAAVAPTKQHQLQQRASSSDFTNTEAVPKVRSTLTGSFKPTSSFGQSLMQAQAEPPTSRLEEEKEGALLGEDVQHHTRPTRVDSAASSSNASNQPRTVNYDALRSVPPPPPSKQPTSTNAETLPQQQTPRDAPSAAAAAVANSRGVHGNDLLADPQYSAQLSQATSDLANVSNQINSLHNQTKELDEKKTKAEQELKRLLNAKAEFESKLKTLRSSYDNEVAQVKQVEASLATAREESEALRSEASIAEAKVNRTSSELHEKQMAVEELQKENGALKEKLTGLNAETVDLEKQLATKQAEQQSLQNQFSVKKSQVQVVIVKNGDLKNKIAEIEESHIRLQTQIDNAEKERIAHEKQQQELEEKQRSLHQNKPTKPSADFSSPAILAGAGAALGATIGGVASVASAVSHSLGSSSTTDNEAQASAPETIHRPEEKGAVQGVKNLPVVGGEPTDNATNATSSVSTEHADETDTPITSPSNSEFQFPQGPNTGIAGGMVGMPGVLVGVQRTDSLTSSVQNNAALSVRDDNIDLSDRETIDQAPEESRDSDKGSSSFEIVNSADARSPDNIEFPPIRELDYQESDSSEEEDDDESQQFDDAVGEFNQRKEQQRSSQAQPSEQTTTVPVKKDDSGLEGADFDDLEPATQDTNTQDKNFFEDGFDDLEAAQVDNGGYDEDFYKDDFALNNQFTNSNAPDFGNQTGETITGAVADNDEWEQLFAGFGNAQPEVGHAQAGPNEEISEAKNAVPEEFAQSSDLSPSEDYAVQELVGMGFDETTAIEALKNQNGDLEAATNYLLDNA
ncbi:uncharacterized protein LODBEIA_P14320 [Lodderomyces beijingensis]|uniref:EH domain-containing and endocytosis protein 1 n=1 Tax=Lodderomyces beijingensis TaxID=1775926 RepID=A0ABP0ZGB2_9ASCO